MSKQKAIGAALSPLLAPMEFKAFPIAATTEAPDEAPTDKVPIQITARTSDAAYHPWYGAIYHDLAGMQLERKTIPLDYCHDMGEVIGYADTFDVTSGDLVVGGFLTPFEDDDRANEIISKGRRGVPWQASISTYGAASVEIVDPGQTAQVNGKQVEGPAYIVRKWNLSGVAICPYGADGQTETQLKAGELPPVTFIRKDNAMTQEVQTPETPAPADRSELKKFIQSFGAADGATWYAEGLDFSAAQEKHAAGLTAQITELSATVTALTGEKTALAEKLTAMTAERDALTQKNASTVAELTRLQKSIDNGEPTPVSHGADGGETPQKHDELAAKVGANVARVAAGCVLKK